MVEKIIINESEFKSDAYDTVFKFQEDSQFYNSFILFKSELGNVAIAFYKHAAQAEHFFHNGILFLGFGQSYVVLDMNKKMILYKDMDSWSEFDEIMYISSKEVVLMFGSMEIKEFTSEGKLLGEICIGDIITGWEITEDKIRVDYLENGSKIYKL